MIRLNKKTAIFTVIMLVSFPLWLVSQICADELGDKLAERFMNNVVQLTVTLSDGGEQDGFGFVVGERGNKLYVVTANHVVRFDDDPDVRTEKVLAQFRGKRGEFYPAKLLNLSDLRSDLGLLEIPKPFRGYQWERKHFWPHPRRNEKAWFIGRNREWYVPPVAGVVSNSPSRRNNRFETYLTTVQSGTSGSPLFTEKGIVGMIILDSPPEVTVSDIETIRLVVEEEWGYPWDLQLYGGQVVSESVRSDKRPDRRKEEPKKDVKPKMEPVHVAQAKPGEHSAGDVWKEPVTGMEFVWVSGGTYQMGCGSWAGDCRDNEKPVHEVYVDGFWMGKYEVTQGQWKHIMGNNPSYFRKGGNYPVERVSWDDAEKFLVKLNAQKQGQYEFRLPTEAEWEYACRSGGKNERYCGGDDLNELGWYAENSESSGTHPAGTKAPNGLGLFDMSGNVGEWCDDIYSSYGYSKHQRDNLGSLNRPILPGRFPAHSYLLQMLSVQVFGAILPGPKTGQKIQLKTAKLIPHMVHRGGGWSVGARRCRSAYRDVDSPGDRVFDLGFRLLRTP